MLHERTRNSLENSRSGILYPKPMLIIEGDQDTVSNIQNVEKNITPVELSSLKDMPHIIGKTFDKSVQLLDKSVEEEVDVLGQDTPSLR